MHKRPLDFDEVDSCLRYESETGDFYWKVSQGRVKAGDRAGRLLCSGYIQIKLYGLGYRAHRLAVLLHTGDDPGDQEINHRNQDKTDNRIQNLEVLNHADHSRKQPKRRDCSSGCTGVSWDKTNQKWQVHISINGKQTTIGCFVDFDEAVKCRKAAEIEHGYFEEHGMSKEEVQKYYEDKEETAGEVK